MPTPIIPASYQTNRADLDAALVAMVDAFIASENYECGRKAMSSIPDSFTGEGPLVVVGDITEEITHTNSIRITRFTGTLYYIDWLTDRDEYAARVNRWADKMRDLFTYNVGVVSGYGELRQVGFQEGEFRQGQLVFGAPSIEFWYNIQEGYQ